MFSGSSVSPGICREGVCVLASHQLSFILENTTKCLYHSVPDAQPQVACTSLGRFLVLFSDHSVSHCSAWIKNADLGCSGGKCLHVSCALLSSKFANFFFFLNVKQQGCAVATASQSLVPCTLGVPAARELCLPGDTFSFSCCDDTVDPLCVMGELLAAVADHVALCLSADCGGDPEPQHGVSDTSSSCEHTQMP